MRCMRICMSAWLNSGPTGNSKQAFVQAVRPRQDLIELSANRGRFLVSEKLRNAAQPLHINFTLISGWRAGRS